MRTFKTITTIAIKILGDPNSLNSPNSRKSPNNKGFTFVEMTLAIGILVVLFGMASVSLGNFMTNHALGTDGERLTQALREAHTRAVAQEGDSAWGLYFDTVSTPEQFILFRGTGFAFRNATYDQASELSRGVTFGPFSLNGGGQEIVFAKRSGLTSHYGFLFLQSQGEAFTIRVNSLGLTDFTPVQP